MGIPADCTPNNPEEAVIQYLSGPDRHGKYEYFLYWHSNYHPGHPDGAHRPGARGQVFLADPREHTDRLKRTGWTVREVDHRS